MKRLHVNLEFLDYTPNIYFKPGRTWFLKKSEIDMSAGADIFYPILCSDHLLPIKENYEDY